MINLYDFIIESLIGSSELNKDFKFVECSKEDMLKLLDTDDYEHGNVLNMSIDDIKNNELFLGPETTYYKIQYQDKILGVFGIVLPNKMVKTIVLDRADNAHYELTWRIWRIFVANSLNKKNTKYDILNLNKNDFDIEALKSARTLIPSKNACRKVLYNTAYITVWAINQHIKKELDINDFALVKLFFKKLIDLAKDNHAKYLWAHGKDARTQKMYIKLGGFIDPAPIIEDYYNNDKNSLSYLKDTILRGIVWKCVDENAKLRNLPDSLKFKDEKSENTPKQDDVKPNHLDDLSDTSKRLFNTILSGIKYGYLPGDNKVKYGISHENIYELADENDGLTKADLKQIVDKCIDMGIKFKYEKDEEWKKAGYSDPLE